MLKNVQLSLMIGPLIPLTPPRAVMDALAEVEVTVNDVGASGFQLTFSIDKQSPLQILFLLTGGSPILFMRVVLVVIVNGVSNVLIDGVITNNEISPGDKGSNSTLTLTGEDLTALHEPVGLERLPVSGLPGRSPCGAAPCQIRGLQGCATHHSKCADRCSSANRPDSEPAGHRPRIHQGFGRQRRIRVLSRPRTGARHEQGLLGPQIKVGPVQPAISADMDAYTNVESLHFKFDQQQSKIATVFIYNEETNVSIPIPLPPITPLNPSAGRYPAIANKYSARPEAGT